MPAKPLETAFCAECGCPFPLTKSHKIYCDEFCRKTAWNRRINGGFKIYELIMRWRIDRPKDGLSELTAVADQLAYDERLVRQKRNERIQKELAKHPKGIFPPDFVPGKSVSEVVKLPPSQRKMAAIAAMFCLSMAGGSIPDDPDKNPANWSKKQISQLSAALATFNGEVSDEETDEQEESAK